MKFRLELPRGFAVAEIEARDKASYLEHFKEKQIYTQTLNIPFPYGEADADWWIDHVAKSREAEGRALNWAIRGPDDRLVGGIGFHDLRLASKSHRAEIGYWLAKPFWGQGITTDAVRAMTRLGFDELGLSRITANVFHFNTGSVRVLEKCGFRLEGRLRLHYQKDGQLFDGLLYGRLKGDA